MAEEIKIYYAHSGNCTDKSDWQLLSDHLFKVGALASNNARFFKGQMLAGISGQLHDLGKYSEAFAKRLEGGKRVDHATAGAIEAKDRWGTLGRIIAFAVSGHHTGLANGIDSGHNRASLDDRLNKEIPELDQLWRTEIELPDKLDFPPFMVAENYQGFQLAFLTRMLFSCLVDADFIDTERFYARLKRTEKNRGGLQDLQKLSVVLDQHLQTLSANSSGQSAIDVNKIRGRILDHAKQQAMLDTGFFSMTVPTGGGKTLASMSFALDHAVKRDLRRIIYVIPFTSIIEQNAEVFRKVFSELGEDIVLEHHSAFEEDTMELRDETKDKLRLAMENWDAPVVVTTAVQFFESLFSDSTSRCRKLHNITGSVIILDEAQVMPLKLLRPTMAALDELVRNYSCSVVLCTATQPALNTPDFYNGFENVREIAPEPKKLFKLLDRVSYTHLGEQTDKEIAERMRSSDQILVIVNNRRHARHLYALMSDQPGCFHLTTLMCARHRKSVLKKIKNRLSKGKSCRVVSTSLIEAGVDVDFPMVMRAEAGLDSIMQAAGRCNREGRSKKEDSWLYIFQSSEWDAPPELKQFAASMRAVWLDKESDLSSPETIKAYFNDVYWRKSDEMDAKTILKQCQDHAHKLTFPFQNIARDYRWIESAMRPIIIPFDKDAQKYIETLRYSEFVGSMARKFQPYLVQVPEKAYAALKAALAIVPINPERFGDQFYKLNNEDLYSMDCGLDWSDPHFIENERMVI